MKDLLVKTGEFIVNNWEAISLSVTSALAIFPTKVNKIGTKIISVLGFLIKKKK